jgi:hypothetical protein
VVNIMLHYVNSFQNYFATELFILTHCSFEKSAVSYVAVRLENNILASFSDFSLNLIIQTLIWHPYLFPKELPSANSHIVEPWNIDRTWNKGIQDYFIARYVWPSYCRK